jgi:hypothetical protein
MIMKSTAIKSLTVSVFATVGLTVALGQSAQAQSAPPIPGFCGNNCQPATAPAKDPMKVSFDENGNGTIVLSTDPNQKPMTLKGTLMLDPSIPVGGTPTMVLVYQLPEPVVAGDVIINEPNTSGAWSDVLRFTDATGILRGITRDTFMIFYSEKPLDQHETQLLADTGFPDNVGRGNNITITEMGINGKPYSEFNNGFNYLPGAPYPFNNQYIGISDAVPEFSTWGMMVLGFAGLGFAGYRKTRNRMALSS